MTYRFAWDAEKNSGNIRKHGISFEEAIDVFGDPNLIEFYDAAHSTEQEDRYIGLGSLENMVILYVVFTDRQGTVRLISARKAESYEQELYYEYLKKNI